MKKRLLIYLFLILSLNCMEKKEDETPLLQFSDSHFQSIESQQNTCSICQEKLKGDIRTLPCGHQFHTLCIGKWEHTFDKEFHCPNCREFTQRIFLTQVASSPTPHPREETPPIFYHPQQGAERREEGDAEEEYDSRLGCAPWCKNLKKTFIDSCWHVSPIRGESLHEKCCTYGRSNCYIKTRDCARGCIILPCSSCYTCFLSDYGIWFPKCCCCQRSDCWSEEQDACSGGGPGACDKADRIFCRFMSISASSIFTLFTLLNALK